MNLYDHVTCLSLLLNDEWIPEKYTGIQYK